MMVTAEPSSSWNIARYFCVSCRHRSLRGSTGSTSAEQEADQDDDDEADPETDVHPERGEHDVQPPGEQCVKPQCRQHVEQAPAAGDKGSLLSIHVVSSLS